MKLYFARHGKMDATPDTPVSPVNGEIDEPLSELGIEQANSLAEQLKDISFNAIITSPLKRAHQTAEIVNKHHNLPIEVDAAWRERVTGGYVNVEDWNNLFDYDKNIERANVEPLNDFFERVYKAIEDLKQKYDDKTILIVAHGGINMAIYMYANKIPLAGRLQGSPIGNCEYRIYEL